MSLVHSQNPAKKQSHYVSTIASNYITIVIVITLFQSQIILAEHNSTNWGDWKSNQMLVFQERGN